MGKATKDLIHEHEAINFGLNILEKICHRIKSGMEVDKNDLLDMVGFLKDFADKCHHGKEEQFLFESLVQTGMSREQSPVAVMLHEHDLGRALIKNMSNSLTNFENSKSEFAGSAENYIMLLRSHIEKENNILFKIADTRLDENAQDEIYAKFEKYEKDVMGVNRHEELHKILDLLSKKYPN
jgi:hemerythrin-like domain-containing protein